MKKIFLALGVLTVIGAPSFAQITEGFENGTNGPQAASSYQRGGFLTGLSSINLGALPVVGTNPTFSITSTYRVTDSVNPAFGLKSGTPQTGNNTLLFGMNNLGSAFDGTVFSLGAVRIAAYDAVASGAGVLEVWDYTPGLTGQAFTVQNPGALAYGMTSLSSMLYDVGASSAPEPGTLVLLSLGGTLVLVRRRRTI
jgi:hypothetical protein